MNTLSCLECASPLDVKYHEKSTHLEIQDMPNPVHSPESLVSLGEGNTPSIHMPNIGKYLGLDNLHAKLEFMNPTGSFKDRGTAVLMSMAKENNIAEIVEDSSGNAGASVSAYAARAGIKAHIFAPANAPSAKIQQIQVYEAESHPIEGPREASTSAAIEFYKKNTLTYVSHNLSPYFIEGTKTFAYEVAQQFQNNLPEHIVIPVGNGSLLIGAWKGFNELKKAGVISRIPRLHCIQAQAVMPIVAAFEGKAWSPEPNNHTIAGGISVGTPPRLQQVLSVLRDSNGIAVAVDDKDITRWHKLLASSEGIYAEPTSAAAFAGLEVLMEQGHIKSNETVLVPVTGFGLKDTPPS